MHMGPHRVFQCNGAAPAVVRQPTMVHAGRDTPAQRVAAL